MAFKLPRLEWSIGIVDKLGKPLQAFQIWWDRVATGIETAVTDLSDTLDRLTTVEGNIDAIAGRNLTAGAGLTGGGDLSADRTFDVGAGTGISVSANAVSLADTTVAAGSYGSASQTVSFVVDAQGRLTAAAAASLVTTNIAEGTNLYFTTARARLALSGGAGISYNNTTGAIAIDATVATLTGAQTLTNKTLTAPVLNGPLFAIRTATNTAGAAPVAGDYTILCNATGAAITVALPAAATSAGRVLSIKKIDASANAVTIDPNGAEPIEGAATLAISVQYDVYTIQCDGTAWWVL